MNINQTFRLCENRTQSDFRPSQIPNLIRTDTTPLQFDEMLRSEPTYSLTMGGSYGSTSLGKAALYGNVALVHHIVAIGGRQLLDLGNSNGCTPLLSALNCINLSTAFPTAKALIRLGSDVNLAAVTAHNSVHGNIPSEATPLWLAVELIKDLRCVKLLIKHGAVANPALSTVGTKFVEIAKEEIKKEKAAKRQILAGMLLKSNLESPLFKLPGDLKRLIFAFIKSID